MGEIVRGRVLVTRWGPPVGVVEDSAVYVEDGQVVAADHYAVLRRHHPGAPTVGDGTHLRMRGLVNRAWPEGAAPSRGLRSRN